MLYPIAPEGGDHLLDFESVADLFEEDVQGELLAFACTTCLACEDN